MELPTPDSDSRPRTAVCDGQLMSALQEMDEASLHRVLRKLSLHDASMLPNSSHVREKCLRARLQDGTLSAC